jgi:hypothetical protein
MTLPTPEDARREETAVTLLAEVEGRLRLLEAARPKSLDGFALSPISKLPFKALRFRESLLWRIVQLGRGAFENFESNKLASAILLTRATTETSSALWYLLAKLKTVVEARELGSIDDSLVKLLMGSRTDPALPQALSVLTFVDHVKKDVEGFREQYDRLSEFAHPNWAGTTLLFSKLDGSGTIADFGESIRGGDSVEVAGVVNLSVALAMFETIYNQITDLMPAFISVCDKRSGQAGTSEA